jgi:hypothetical protein
LIPVAVIIAGQFELDRVTRCILKLFRMRQHSTARALPPHAFGTTLGMCSDLTQRATASTRNANVNVLEMVMGHSPNIPQRRLGQRS